MKSKKDKSITALMSAFVRAYICKNKRSCVFSDNMAEKLISDEEYNQIKNYILSGVDFFVGDEKENFQSDEDLLNYIVENQLAPNVIARSKFCEDSLKTAILSGVSQYVILGAGMDTFALRENELMKKISVYEVDYPSTQADKIARVKKISDLENLKFVPADFSSDNIKDKLIEYGFDVNKKTFFSLLGVSYYLTEKEFCDLFENISSFAAEGSSIVFDYAEESILKSNQKRAENMIKMAQAGGEPMKFFANFFDMEIILDRYNFLIYETLSPDDIQNKYFQNENNYLSAFPDIYFCLCTLKGTAFINTKEKILLTSLQLFAKNGYDAVSVRDIARNIGITQSALYKHYKNKRDIFDNIVQRMQEEDFSRAKKYEVPEDVFSKMSEKYNNTPFENLKKYAFAQFRYWTEDAFASNFRKMITVEQYKNDEVSTLFQNHLSGGVINYVADIFREMINKGLFKNCDEYVLAAQFYAPLFLMMNVYDSADDKKKVTECVLSHIQNF